MVTIRDTFSIIFHASFRLFTTSGRGSLTNRRRQGIVTIWITSSAAFHASYFFEKLRRRESARLYTCKSCIPDRLSCNIYITLMRSLGIHMCAVDAGKTRLRGTNMMYVYAAAILAFHFSPASSSQQHLICKTVEDVFAESSNIPINDTTKPQPAAATPVDYAKIGKLIDEKVALALKKVKFQGKGMAEITTKPPPPPPGSQKSCEEQKGGFFNHSKCYIIPHLSTSEDLTYAGAVAECKKYGYLLAEIHGLVHQKALLNYVLRKKPSGYSVTLWVGMEYKSLTSKMLYRSGKEVSKDQFIWSSGPESISSKKIIVLESNRRFRDWDGIRNIIGGSEKQNGVLCESP